MDSALTQDIAIDPCWSRVGVWRNGTEKCPQLDQVIHCRNCEVFRSTGRRLLDRELPATHLQEWTEVLAKPKRLEPKGRRSAVAFRLGAEWLALPVALFSEVTTIRSIHKIPHNKDARLRGLVNIRGELQPCVSLGNVLGLDKPDEDWTEEGKPLRRLVVMDVKGQRFVFPVSEIKGIVRYTPEQLEPPPATVTRAKHNFIAGILAAGDPHIGCVDEPVVIKAMQEILV